MVKSLNIHTKYALKTILIAVFMVLLLSGLNAKDDTAISAVEIIKPLQQDCGKLTLIIDPRIELIATLQYLSGSKMVMKEHDGYADSIDAWFAPYKNHPVFEHLRKMENKGFSYDLPITFFLQYKKVPLYNKANTLQTEDQSTFDARMKDVGKSKDIHKFVEEVNDFVSISGYNRFWDKESSYLHNQLARGDSLMRETGIVETIIDWYGYSFDSYNLVISPLQGFGGYGPSIVNSTGGVDIFCITALQGKVIDDNVRIQMAYMMFHEFSHPYNNPLISEYYNRFYKARNLFKPIKKIMDKQAYGKWWITLAEHYVRACTQRLLNANKLTHIMGSDTGDDMSKGFIYIDYISDGLKRYEEERSKNNVLYKDYFPNLVNDLVALSRHPQEYIASNLSFKGPLNVVSFSESIVIVPDPETNPGVTENIMPTVNAIFKNNGIPVITDKEALKRKFKHVNLYVYGTIDTNKWLQKYKQLLPFVILPDKIIADKEYTGTDLRIISCLPNPDNPEQGIAIYTAQNMAAMKHSNAPFHGDEDFVVSNSNSDILGKGYYDKDGKVWKFKPKSDN